MTAPAALKEYVRSYLAEARSVLADDYLVEALGKVVPIFATAREQGRLIFFFGNGGSASTSAHFVTDIAKDTFRGTGPRFRCFALADNVDSLTAWANDADFTKVFSEELKGLARAGDVAVAISGSGDSPNILEGAATAKAMGLTTIGLTGRQGGKLKGLVDVALVVPSQSMQHIQDVHMVFLHLLDGYFRDVHPPARGG
jgi:D-sedoheptulose 7-phosphate isomerase